MKQRRNKYEIGRWRGARRITNGGRKNIGKFPSLKNKRSVWYESLLERDFIYLLEIDPDVISYWEQPFKIRYSLNKEIHMYTPDFFVVRSKGKQVVEVKKEDDAKKEENAAVYRRVAPICQREGLGFLVATDGAIRSRPRLDNAKLLHKYSRTPLSHKDQIHAYAFFAKRKESSLAELIGFFASHGAGRQVVYALIYWGVFWIDLAEPIGPKSVVSMPMSQYLKEKIA